MNSFPTVIEHGKPRQTRFLRQQRLRIALAIAAVEGILVLAGSIPWWIVPLAAAAALALHTWLPAARVRAVRQVTWIAAVSQLVVALVPIAAALVTALAIVLLALFAVMAARALLRDRR